MPIISNQEEEEEDQLVSTLTQYVFALYKRLQLFDMCVSVAWFMYQTLLSIIYRTTLTQARKSLQSF